jgi:hypothetical protein
MKVNGSSCGLPVFVKSTVHPTEITKLLVHYPYNTCNIHICCMYYI